MKTLILTGIVCGVVLNGNHMWAQATTYPITVEQTSSEPDPEVPHTYNPPGGSPGVKPMDVVEWTAVNFPIASFKVEFDTAHNPCDQGPTYSQGKYTCKIKDYNYRRDPLPKKNPKRRAKECSRAGYHCYAFTVWANGKPHDPEVIVDDTGMIDVYGTRSTVPKPAPKP